MDGDVESLLDLSHLTDDEQATILDVLLRDSDLRCRDEGRVSDLQQNESDPHRLRSLSGAWFRDERAKRHRKDGVDIVQASIRRRKRTKDTQLNGLFNGPTGEAVSNSLHHDASPQLHRKEEERKKTDDRLTPSPLPRTRILPPNKNSPSLVSNGTSSSTESTGRSSARGEETAEIEERPPQTASPSLQDSGKDTDSLYSKITEPKQTPNRTSGSISSLHSNPALSGSMMSLFSSGEFGTVEVSGRIQFSLHYDTKKEELQVQVCRCQELAQARKNRSDPYVKAYLLPDKSSHSKKKTAVKKKTVNPLYDEILKYKVPMVELKGRTLNLSVWHHDPLRRNVFLGEVEVGLLDWDWSQTHPQWHPLQPRVQLSQDTISSRGTILLSLKFIPAGSEGSGLPLTGELHIWLREAQGLIPTRTGAVDSYVKSYMLPDESRSSRQKTRVMKRTVSPTFNHTMVYDGFQSADLLEACAELTVWERDALTSHPLGGVRLSLGTGKSYGEPVVWMDSNEEEVCVWNTVIQNPNTWVDATLPLRTNLTPRQEKE